MGRPRNRADLIPETRGAFKRALKIMEEDGRPLSTIIIELFEKDPRGALDLLIKLHPKEMLIQQDVNHNVAIDLAGMSTDLLQEAMNARRALEAGDTEPDTPVH